MIIDFHTHAFPDQIATRAIPALEQEGEIKAQSDGTLDGLLQSMDRAGIDTSVICSIATRPAQFEPILSWSQKIRSSRIIPLPSVHPADENVGDRVAEIAEQGFVGIKMHPYYQEFIMDEERLFPLYHALQDAGLLLVMHTGFDIAFPRTRVATPEGILAVLEKFPDLKLITTHLGGWDMWDEVEENLIGQPVYMEISFALQYLSRDQAFRMLNDHPSDYLLFGSDSPWDGQEESVNRLRGLGLGARLEALMLGGNAARLLNL